MFKKVLSILLISSLFLTGCTKGTEEDNSDIPTPNNQDAKNKISSNIKSKEITYKNIIISGETLTLNKFLYLGNLLFFANPKDGDKLTLAEIPNTNTYIKEDYIKNSYDYSINYLTSINNIIYFSSTSQNNRGLYTFNYEKDAITKLNDDITINLISNENYLYYINSSDKLIYSYNTKSKEKKLLSNNKAGKFIFNNNFIFYQNLNDNSKLYALKSDGTANIKLTDVSVDSFITYNNGLLFFDSSNDNILCFLDLTQNKITKHSYIKGENLKQYNDNIYYINKESPNSLNSLNISDNEDKFEANLILSDYVNDYFITNGKIFIDKASNLNGIQVLNIE
ncbi:MAG: DUF5050 domain-containing protein [Clostridiales bacterium]|nr:DUF5050 domain-containing protein [Clostridiales bacterium]